MKPRHVNHYTDIKYVNIYFLEKLYNWRYASMKKKT